MKRLTRVVLLLLAAAMTMGLLSACQSTQAKIEALSGTWTMVEADTEEQALALLENIDLYEEEIAHVDLTSLQYVQLVEFTTDKTYRFAYDVEGTKACVREFFTGAFDALYENRASLNETYALEFDAMTQEEFQQFYAELYDVADFATLMDEITEGAYDYEALGEDWETGTYDIVRDQILCTITGETEAESLGYSIDGDVLVLVYSNATETYTKAN